MSDSALLVLYEVPISPYVQKVKIALREKGVGFDAKMPTGFGAGGSAKDFLDLNPFEEVPVLVDGECSVFDSTIIMEYLEEKFPKPDLLSDNPRLAAKARMIEEVMDTRFEPLVWGVHEIKMFKRIEGEPADLMLERAAQQAKALYQWLESQLGDAAWFCPPHFGWADIAVAPHINNALWLEIGPPPQSPLSAWFSRAIERKSVADTFAEGETGRAMMERVNPLFASGRLTRQYRDHRLEWMLRTGGLAIVLDGVEKGWLRFSRELPMAAEER